MNSLNTLRAGRNAARQMRQIAARRGLTAHVFRPLQARIEEAFDVFPETAAAIRGGRSAARQMRVAAQLGCLTGLALDRHLDDVDAAFDAVFGCIDQPTPPPRFTVIEGGLR